MEVRQILTQKADAKKNEASARHADRVTEDIQRRVTLIAQRRS